MMMTFSMMKVEKMMNDLFCCEIKCCATVFVLFALIA